jgi:hypothetical protein
MSALTLTLDSTDVERILALLDRIDDPQAMPGDPASDGAWERREYAIQDLTELLRNAVMER